MFNFEKRRQLQLTFDDSMLTTMEGYVVIDREGAETKFGAELGDAYFEETNEAPSMIVGAELGIEHKGGQSDTRAYNGEASLESVNTGRKCM
jgi:hypothetical protein